MREHSDTWNDFGCWQGAPSAEWRGKSCAHADIHIAYLPADVAVQTSQRVMDGDSCEECDGIVKKGVCQKCQRVNWKRKCYPAGWRYGCGGFVDSQGFGFAANAFGTPFLTREDAVKEAVEIIAKNFGDEIAQHLSRQLGVIPVMHNQLDLFGGL
jgi:hypothetical protein